MRHKQTYAAIIILSALGGMLCLAFSSQTGSITIGNVVTISTISVTAKSGSSIDIQTAVNAVHVAGGGTVYVPAGNFTFNITAANKIGVDNSHCGVYVYAGVSIIGAGNNQTVLYCPIDCWNSTDWGTAVYNTMFTVDGGNTNGMPVRISGIYFEGSVNMTAGDTQADNNPALTAIKLYGVNNYRVDHCTFINFDNFAIFTSPNYGPQYAGNCGVIDHCIIDNPYKALFANITGAGSYWAYGIGVSGTQGLSYGVWDPHWTDYFGIYKNDTCIIEDCSIAECRHCISAGQYGYYIARNDVFYDQIVNAQGGYCDAHGTTEGVEIYNCTFINVPIDYRSYPQNPGDWGIETGEGVGLRGGFGLIYNNTFENYGLGEGVLLTNDAGLNSTYRLNGVWIWGNTIINTSNLVHNDSTEYPVLQGEEYFLRAPTLAQDGFTYTPYTYPSPLTQP